MVGTVHAQLVRASRDGREGDELMPVDNLKQVEAGDGGLAMHKVDELSRTVIEVWTQRQRYRACVRRMPHHMLACQTFMRHPFEQGEVALADGVVKKLLLQGLMRLAGAGDEEQSAGVHIETVNDDRHIGSYAVMLAHNAFYRQTATLAWHAEHARRLRHHRHLLILIYNM